MNHIELRFSALLQNESFARVAVASFITSANPTIEEMVEIKTIVSEAVSNAIIHGYKLDGSRDVYVKAYLNNDEVEIIVQDYGVGIKNIEAIMTGQYHDDSDTEHSGMGIVIMKSLSNSFDIQSTEELGTKVVIKKKLSCTGNKLLNEVEQL